MHMLTLKLEMSLMLEETVRVRVAGTDCPGARSVFCWFHVTVIGPFALVGLQLLVDMVRLSESPLLVFLM